MKEKRIDVKTQCFRFTYDPEVLGPARPVAIQCRWVWGKKGDIAYLRLNGMQVEKLYEFLEGVLHHRFDDRMECSGGPYYEQEKG